uniref:F-box domain-containing protein n=1 Tax=Heterorhabditis bacteriophora TaxID=37862 RepID=A0A1I7X5F9_HETBA
MEQPFFPFLHLPCELRIKVLRNLSFRDVCRMRLLCRAVNSTILDNRCSLPRMKYQVVIIKGDSVFICHTRLYSPDYSGLFDNEPYFAFNIKKLQEYLLHTHINLLIIRDFKYSTPLNGFWEELVKQPAFQKGKKILVEPGRGMTVAEMEKTLMKTISAEQAYMENRDVIDFSYISQCGNLPWDVSPARVFSHKIESRGTEKRYALDNNFGKRCLFTEFHDCIIIETEGKSIWNLGKRFNKKV